MGQATFLDLIKAIRRLSLKQIFESCDYYKWEIGGFLILTFVTAMFSNLLSEKYLYLLCSYFWGWTLASPKLIWKTESKRYRLTLLRIIVNSERKLRQALLFDRMRTSKLYRPIGRVLSVLVLGLFVTLILKSFLLQYFLIGALCFEFFRLLKSIQQPSF